MHAPKEVAKTAGGGCVLRCWQYNQFHASQVLTNALCKSSAAHCLLSLRPMPSFVPRAMRAASSLA